MVAELKCPYCGKETQVGETALERVKQGFFLFSVAPAILALGSSRKRLAEANNWTDIKCSQCDKTYQYNMKTNVVRA